MTVNECAHGESVARAARTGRWSAELTAHVAVCAACREASHVVRWMGELAETMEAASPPPPDPGLIWLKARIRRRSADLERALLPLRIAGALSAAGLGAMLALLPGLSRAPVQEWLASAGALASQLPQVPLPPVLATLWIPGAILATLLLVWTAGEA